MDHGWGFSSWVGGVGPWLLIYEKMKRN